MTIDEAIKHCEEVAEAEEQKYKEWKGDYSHLKKIDSCLECAKDHRQLAEWLKELQKCKTILNELKDEIKRAFDDLTESENEYGEDDSYTEYNRGCVWGLLHAYEMFGREYEEVNADDE